MYAFDGRKLNAGGPNRQGSPAFFLGALVTIAFAVFTFIATPVRAQIQPPPPAVVLTSVAASSTAGDAQISLSFAPQAPKYSLIGDGSDKPSIAFELASRGLSANFPSDLHGLLRTMSVEQNDGVLILHFVAATSVHMTVTTTGSKIIALKFAKAGAALQASGAAPAASAGPLPTQMDREPSQDGFEVVPLKYADVSEVVGLLTEGQSVKSNDLFTPREPAFGSAGMGGTSAFTPTQPETTQSPDDPLAQSVTDAIGIDRRLNAIILRGAPDRIARLKQKIAEIDVPVQSVILETMFVEMDETGARNVGLNFNNTAGQIGIGTFQTGAYIPSGFPITQGLSSSAFQASIYAQVQSQHGRIVSKPRISAQSGATAKIITGDALPILTSISLAGVNGVSQQVQYVNVGVTLQIAPRVSDDGFVTSHVFCVVSSVTGYQQGYPTISQREAQTSATVRDGETFVIGGLSQENSSLGSSKVPLLGDIPLLDQLFDLHQDTKSKTDLYIVVTPHIVKRDDILPKQVSAEVK